MPNRKLKNKRPDTTETLEGRLYARRLDCNLSAVELSRKAGITSAGYCRYECGVQTGMHAATLFKLAKAINCSPVWLWTGEGNHHE